MTKGETGNMTSHYLLAIDQGTTSTRAIVFTEEGRCLAQHQVELTQYYPAEGWVEHSAAEIWQATLLTCRQALQTASIHASQLIGIGVTNQRETTVVWNRKTGQPVHAAIVWQDRRTADYCLSLKNKGLESKITAKTGLLLDPYFSGTKLTWILDKVDPDRTLSKQGELAFGTIDTYLLWQLTAGREHKTDATNASRTLLFNIQTQCWDDELLSLFNIPKEILPSVENCCSEFGLTEKDFLGASVPIRGMAGDQQAALIGQACFEPGSAKSTYGTGCFLMANMGESFCLSQHRLLTTVAYRLNNKTTYALEGSIFIAGAGVQWLRDSLKIIAHADESERWAVKSNGETNGVYLVPAFTGLGAPHWDPEARGAIVGLTRNSGIAEIVTATLQSVCYQTYDLIDSIQKDTGCALRMLKVDGGMVKNDWLMQFLSDITRCTVSRPVIQETTALGAAYLAGLQAGLFHDLADIEKRWLCDKHFLPSISPMQQQKKLKGWHKAVERVLLK